MAEPLKEWYELSSQWDQSLMATRRIRQPHQIDVHDNMAIFMEDTTGDWLWAFGTDGRDLVFDAKLGEPWEQSAEGLAELLTHMTLSEATFSARSWRECGKVPESSLPAVLGPMTQIAFGGWRWPHPGGRLYQADLLLAEVLPAMAPGAPWEAYPGYFEVRVASPDSAKLEFLDMFDELKWLRK